jgi:hypothetical protein
MCAITKKPIPVGAPFMSLAGHIVSTEAFEKWLFECLADRMGTQPEKLYGSGDDSSETAE